jgi:hypothetical protein
VLRLLIAARQAHHEQRGQRQRRADEAQPLHGS